MEGLFLDISANGRQTGRECVAGGQHGAPRVHHLQLDLAARQEGLLLLAHFQYVVNAEQCTHATLKENVFWVLGTALCSRAIFVHSQR
jgi:hypothetical protein